MRIIGRGVAVVALVILTGCAGHSEQPADPDLSIAAAKKITQAAEAKAMHLVPRSDIERVEQLKSGTLLSCSSGWLWSGAIKATLRPGIKGADVQEALAEVAKEHGFTATRDILLTGDARLELVDANNVQLLVTVYNDGTLLNVDSASPCISLPDDFRPPADF